MGPLVKVGTHHHSYPDIHWGKPMVEVYKYARGTLTKIKNRELHICVLGTFRLACLTNCVFSEMALVFSHKCCMYEDILYLVERVRAF